MAEESKHIFDRDSSNFGWSKFIPYIDGWIPKVSLFIPIIGYLILFNDEITNMLQFMNLTGGEPHSWGLEGIERLRFLYFGMIFLGASNIIYRARRPRAFEYGTNEIDFTNTCWEQFNYHNYRKVRRSLLERGHRTYEGGFSEQQWENFTHIVQGKIHSEEGNWELAKKQYEGMLKGFIFEKFFNENQTNLKSLSFCLILSTLGYFFMFIPSADLFIKVLLVTIQ